jgi:aspartyl/asparaginyl beta-hydroxylase (cupin superfamily)
MTRNQKKAIRRTLIAVPLLVLLLWFIPIIVAIWVVAGLIDFARNKAKTRLMLSRYFVGNGIPTWILSPFNLFIDLLSYRNPGVYTLDDFPPAYRDEIEAVLGTFRTRKDEIVAEVDRQFSDGRRGMYVWRWYGKQHQTNVPEFNREFRYVLGQGIHHLALRPAAPHPARAAQSQPGR